MKYDAKKINEHLTNLMDMQEYIVKDIIYAKNIDSPNHFDKLSKEEQIKLVHINGYLNTLIYEIKCYLFIFSDTYKSKLLQQIKSINNETNI